MDFGIDYSKAKGLFSKSIGTAGSIVEKGRGLLAKLLGEEVSSNQGC